MTLRTWPENPGPRLFAVRPGSDAIAAVVALAAPAAAGTNGQAVVLDGRDPR